MQKLFKNINLKKIIEYGFYLLVFLLPWQTRLILRNNDLNRGPWQYGQISLYGVDILLIILLILQTIIFIKNRGAKENNNKNNFLLIFLSAWSLIIFVSTFFAPDKILSFYRLGVFLLGLGIFWLIIKVDYNKIKLSIAFFSSLAIQGVLATWQFLTQEALACKWLGLAYHSPADLGASVVDAVGSDGIGERWLRAYGSLDHPNILGGVMAIGLIFIFYSLANHKRVDNKKTDRNYIFYCLFLFLISAGLIFSFSRSAALAFVVGIIFLLISKLFKKDWGALKKTSGAIILFLILFSVIFANYQNLFITRAEAKARLETKSLVERKMYLNDSLRLIKKNWLFGIGIGNYTKALSNSEARIPWYYLEPVHNTFLLVWVETGIFGLIFFLSFLFYLFVRVIKNKSILSLSLLLALVIMMSFDHYSWSLHFGVLFFWFIVGIIYKNHNLSLQK